MKRVRRLLDNPPADRAWRRRCFVVLCRVFPDRERLNLPPRTDGGVDSGTHGAVAATRAPETLSRRRRLEVSKQEDNLLQTWGKDSHRWTGRFANVYVLQAAHTSKPPLVDTGGRCCLIKKYTL